MKKIIPITLSLLLMFFASTALAERGSNNSQHNGYTSKGKRVERHLDARGDQIERHFDRKASRAADRGNYRQALRFQNKGNKINRHLDRKGKQRHARIDQRRHINWNRHQHHKSHAHVVIPVQGNRHHDNFFNLVIQQPGFLFGWSGYN